VKVPHGQGTPASGTNEEREDEAAPQELIMENGDSANDEGVTPPVGPPIPLQAASEAVAKSILPAEGVVFPSVQTEANTPASGTNEEREDEAAPQEVIMENRYSANNEGVTPPVGPPILRGTYEIEGDSAVAGVGSAVHVPAKEIHKRLSSAKVREVGEPALKNQAVATAPEQDVGVCV
jgi:hypothetical protein